MPRAYIRWILFFCVLSGFLGFSVSLYMHPSQPVAPSYTTQTVHYPAIFVKQLAGDPEAGRKIFKEFCAACHDKDPIIPVKAPRIGDKPAWAKRRERGMTHLLKVTTEGVGAMPARGGCFECSDAQLQETIRYILTN